MAMIIIKIPEIAHFGYSEALFRCSFL
jgi:hypothetical protein